MAPFTWLKDDLVIGAKLAEVLVSDEIRVSDVIVIHLGWKPTAIAKAVLAAEQSVQVVLEDRVERLRVWQIAAKQLRYPRFA